MKNLIIIFISSLFCFSACSPNTEVKQQLQTAEAELAKATEALALAQENIKALTATDDIPIVHTVYFKTIDDISNSDLSNLISEIKKLKQIEVVKELEVGTFLDVGDTRALSDYDIVMQLGFARESDMATYQEHPIHLGLKEQLGPWLGGPPAVHDFEVK